MQDCVDGSGHVNVVTDVGPDEAEVFMLEEMRDVVWRAGDEVVQADHFVVLKEQAFAQV